MTNPYAADSLRAKRWAGRLLLGICGYSIVYGLGLIALIFGTYTHQQNSESIDLGPGFAAGFVVIFTTPVVVLNACAGASLLLQRGRQRWPKVVGYVVAIMDIGIFGIATFVSVVGAFETFTQASAAWILGGLANVLITGLGLAMAIGAWVALTRFEPELIEPPLPVAAAPRYGSLPLE